MRKQVELTISEPQLSEKEIKDGKTRQPGRDEGKTFVITEMPASQAEKWAMRALMIAARSGLQIPNASGLGMQGIAALGIGALMSGNWEEIEPLMNEMMACVQVKVSAPGHQPIIRDLFEDDIEEVATRIRIRQAVIELHVGFSIAGDASNSTSAAPAKS